MRIATLVALVLGVLAGRPAAPAVLDVGAGRIAARADHRIVSVSPALTEILFAIGAGDRVVADSDYCDYPAAARALPKIGAVINLSVERVVAHRPSLIVAASGSRDQWLHLRKVTSAPVYVAHDGGISAVRADIRNLGRITRREAEAGRLDRRIAEKLAHLGALTRSGPRPRVFFLVWDDPLMTAGGSSYLDDLITAGGGSNIAHERREPYPRLSWEQLLAASPEVVLGPANLKPAVEATGRKVRAVRIAVLDPDIVSRPGPRVLEALDLFFRAIKTRT